MHPRWHLNCSVASRWSPTTRSIGEWPRPLPLAPCSWRVARFASPARTLDAERSGIATWSSWIAKQGGNTNRLKSCYRDGGKLYVYDSLLSEFAALGFEYGYSVARPDALVMWEAQFTVTSSMVPRRSPMSSSLPVSRSGAQRSAVTLLLPHGLRRQVGRTTQECARRALPADVRSGQHDGCDAQHPASYFHLLRWQVFSRLTRPLIIFTPEVAPACKAAVSTKDGIHVREPSSRSYHRSRARRTGDPQGSAVQREDLLRPRGAPREAWIAQHGDSALQPASTLPFRTRPRGTADRYPNAEMVWVQENRPTRSMVVRGDERSPMVNRPIEGVTRPSSSSPAVGTHQRHVAEQQAVVEQAFA